MKTTFLFVALFSFMGCAGIIYSIRGPKYKGKFDNSKTPNLLDTTTFYRSNKKHYGVYSYVKFGNDGKLYGYASGNEIGSKDIDTGHCTSIYYAFKRGYIVWEIYRNGWEGFDFYKAQVYKDSIISWKVSFAGDRKIDVRTYYKLP